MKYIYLITTFYLFLLPTINAQIEITGTITNTYNNPIPFSNIVIKNNHLGTISNDDGRFKLFIPKDCRNNQIQISCLGYQTLNLSIDSISNCSENLQITLQPKTYDLAEVKVDKKSMLSAQEIVLKAITITQRHFNTNGNLSKYYFRQSHTNKDTLNRLIQAAITIYDANGQLPIESCKINVDEIQTSLDNRPIDYKALYDFYNYKKSSKTFKTNYNDHTTHKQTETQRMLINFFDNFYASLSDFYIKANLIRGTIKTKRPTKKIFITDIESRPVISTKSFTKEHNFKFDTFLVDKEELIYKIKILPSKKYIPIKYQENALIPIGYAYIRSRDNLMLGLEYAYIRNLKHKTYRKNATPYFSFEIRFVEHNNSIYLNYLSYSRKDYNFSYNNAMKHTNWLKQELICTNIITDHKQIQEELKQKEWDADLYKEHFYNAEFWKTYNTFLETEEQKVLHKQLKAATKEKEDIQ